MLSLIFLLAIFGCDCKSKKPVQQASKAVKESGHGHFHSTYQNGVNTKKTFVNPKTSKPPRK